MTATSAKNPNPDGRDLPDWGAVGNGAHRHAVITIGFGRVATMCGKQAVEDRIRVRNIAELPLLPRLRDRARRTVSDAGETSPSA